MLMVLIRLDIETQFSGDCKIALFHQVTDQTLQTLRRRVEDFDVFN